MRQEEKGFNTNPVFTLVDMKTGYCTLSRDKSIRNFLEAIE